MAMGAWGKSAVSAGAGFGDVCVHNGITWGNGRMRKANRIPFGAEYMVHTYRPTYLVANFN